MVRQHLVAHFRYCLHARVKAVVTHFARFTPAVLKVDGEFVLAQQGLYFQVVHLCSSDVAEKRPPRNAETGTQQ